jgi:S-adenosylmethionine hydrolase
MTVVTLTTDFGTTDPFVGIMKGVIATRAPDATVIDVSHGVPPQDVLAGALVLRHAVPYFPPDAIHVAVVDPGVGSSRRAICVATTAGTLLVGPDNGVLSLAAPSDVVARPCI